MILIFSDIPSHTILNSEYLFMASIRRSYLLWGSNIVKYTATPPNNPDQQRHTPRFSPAYHWPHLLKGGHPIELPRGPYTPRIGGAVFSVNNNFILGTIPPCFASPHRRRCIERQSCPSQVQEHATPSIELPPPAQPPHKIVQDGVSRTEHAVHQEPGLQRFVHPSHRKPPPTLPSQTSPKPPE